MSYVPDRTANKRIIAFFDKLLKNATPSIIAQAVLFSLNDLHKLGIDLNYKEKNAFIRAMGDLYQTLDPVFDWKLDKIDIALSSTSALGRRIEDRQFDRRKEKIERCLRKNKCEGAFNASQQLMTNIYKISEISNHPVHILDQDNRINPSAFIPFCQFVERVVGTKIQQFSYKVCTGFKPTIHEKQLCYSLNVNNMEYSKGNIPIYEEEALMLFLDYNIERSSQVDLVIEIQNKSSSQFDFVKTLDPSQAIRKRVATIHLNTLEEFSNLGGRKFEMSSVKIMRATSEFDKFNERVKKCQNRESRAQCMQQNLLNDTIKYCSCIPFHLMPLETMRKVKLK